MRREERRRGGKKDATGGQEERLAATHTHTRLSVTQKSWCVGRHLRGGALLLLLPLLLHRFNIQQCLLSTARSGFLLLPRRKHRWKRGRKVLAGVRSALAIKTHACRRETNILLRIVLEARATFFTNVQAQVVHLVWISA